MNVRELKKALEGVDDDLEILVELNEDARHLGAVWNAGAIETVAEDGETHAFCIFAENDDDGDEDEEEDEDEPS
jgi:ribosomal protein L12E/L44/L45/RPP1/RPP2